MKKLPRQGWYHQPEEGPLHRRKLQDMAQTRKDFEDEIQARILFIPARREEVYLQSFSP